MMAALADTNDTNRHHPTPPDTLDTNHRAQNGEMKILRVAERAGVKTSEISLILHTHAHVDYAGSTSALAKTLNVPTAVHHGDLIGALRDVHLPDHQSGAGGPGVDDLGFGFARPGVKRATRAVQLLAVNGDHFPLAEAAPRL